VAARDLDIPKESILLSALQPTPTLQFAVQLPTCGSFLECGQLGYDRNERGRKYGWLICWWSRPKQQHVSILETSVHTHGDA